MIFVIALLALELVVGATVGLVNLSRANTGLQSLYEDSIVCLGQLDKMVRKLNLNQIDLLEGLSVTPEALPQLLSDIDKNNAAIEEQWRAYAATQMTAEEKIEAERFLQVKAGYMREVQAPAVDALRSGDSAKAAGIVHTSMRKLFVPVRLSIDHLIQIQLDQADNARRRSQSTFEIVRVVCLAGMVLGLVVAAVAGAMLVRGIVRPLREAVRVAGAVAAGDLSHHIPVESKDETGRLMQSLNEMSYGLTDIVSRVRVGTDTIATASSQIAAGNLDLSARTEQQAASLEKAASSMEQLTATVKQNADNARQANTLAMSASEVASKGGQVMQDVVTTMGEINASSKQIVEIVSVIDSIAFQTNILALNAAVEAARAGEQGRGFAVVASEVRNLAQRSAAAAKEVKSLIDGSVQKVNIGSDLVDQAGATMQKIVSGVQQVTTIMSEIMTASDEQAAGIEQVSEAVSQMDQVTQQNAALVEQASAAAASLKEEAESLTRTVSTFRLRHVDNLGLGSVPDGLHAPGLPAKICLTSCS